MGYTYPSSFTNTLSHCRREAGRLYESEVVDNFQKAVFSGHDRSVIHMNSEGVTAYPRPLQAQARQNPNMEGG